MKQLFRFAAFLVSLFVWFSSYTLHSQSSNFTVPIKVSEALVASATGITRSAEPVTLGIPIPDEHGIKEVNNIGLLGSSAYQFRVLDRWPSGNIKWVLVDFLADIIANSSSSNYTLTIGSGPTGGFDLAQDLGNSILVNTGAMEVEISKTQFDLFRQLTVNGTSFIDPGQSLGIELVDKDGTSYLSKNDASPTVQIEENGPVRAVVKAEGSHFSSNGKKMLDYTVRMHFYKGKSRVRVFYTLRNASHSQVVNAGIQYLNLNVKTNIQNGEFEFPTHNNVISGNLGQNDNAAIYQAYSSYPQVRDYDFVPPIPFDGSSYEQEGYQILKNGSVLASGGRDSYPDLFYNKLSDGQRCIVTGVRFAAGLWPKSLHAGSDGSVKVGLYPSFNPHPTYIRFGSHNTYEILFEFSTDSQLDAHSAMRRFQYPLVAKAPVNWYNESDALYERIVSFADERAYYGARGWPTPSRRPDGWPVGGLKIYRHKYWGEGGGGNQYDFTRINLINFIREDKLSAGEYFLMAEQRLQYNADNAAYHSDDFNAELRDEDWPDEDADKVSKAKVIFEMEHRHWYGMSLYYFMSGDERFKDTVVDWAEYLVWAAKTNQNKWERALAWNIFGLTELYRFTHDESFLDLAKQIFHDEIFNSDYALNQSAGFSRLRGYFISRNRFEGQSTTVTTFMNAAILYRALQLLYDELPFSDMTKLHVGDVLTGLSWFAYNELWFYYGPDANDYGYPYVYDTESTPPQDVRTEGNWWAGLREIFEVPAKGYQMTGDSRFLERIDWTLKDVAHNLMGVYWFQDYPGIQQMLWLVNNLSSAPRWQLIEIEASKENNGDYRLSWTVPENAKFLQIKFSEKLLVEWLGFDRYARTYEHDPQLHEPYFAAAHLPGIRNLEDAGTRQTDIVTNLDATKNYNFMAKVYIDPAGTITNIDRKAKGSLEPKSFKLMQNYPNPFNPTTDIVFELSKGSHITLNIFNLSGQLVRPLLSAIVAPGQYKVTWDGNDRHGHPVSSGVYIYRFNALDFVAQRKMLLLK